MRTFGLLVLAALSLVACRVATESDAEAAARIAAGSEGRELRSEAVRPYATAVSARLFVTKPFVRPAVDEPVRELTAKEKADLIAGISNRRDTRVYEEPTGRLLTPSERTAFEATLKMTTYSSDFARAACFVPHHFVRYYDATGRQIGEIAVCFCCAQIAAQPHLPQEGAQTGGQLRELSMDTSALKALIETMGYRTDIDCHEEPEAP